LIQFIPDDPIENVGMVHVAARRSPRPQASVRVRNDSKLRTAELKVDDNSRMIGLPDRGGEQYYFFDMPQLGSSVSFELIVKDDIELDNHSWLALRGSWPIVEARPGLPDALQRMIAIYARSRRPSDSSRHVV